MATNTTKSGMGGGGMGGHGCKISMLWNWNTIDSCFIASSWKITSKGVFAGSCIGVVCLTIMLELLRRATKEYDRYLLDKHLRSTPVLEAPTAAGEAGVASAGAVAACQIRPYRPSVYEQAIRALLHLLQFAVGYFVMLLAMYYNGYIIICIFIGAYIGAFLFHWEPLGTGLQTSATRDATVCCG
ncbi:putative high affinity copper protein [Cladorrhinum samala]|uniref:Copper transport protein n=1 Tax=Cladorrhinum samala TaxID=585594 RepID=A0AAV9HN10_9PEZI|nr:putative high affinity copper protein [Cladorrhinum samala]